MPRISSAGAATISAQDSIEALQNTVPDPPFAALNDTHHAVL